jgi:hypothetical protein
MRQPDPADEHLEALLEDRGTAVGIGEAPARHGVVLEGEGERPGGARRLHGAQPADPDHAPIENMASRSCCEKTSKATIV